MQWCIRTISAARAEAIDHYPLPQRAVAVKRHRHQLADQPLQRGGVPRRGERDMVQVTLEPEPRVVLPAGRTQRQPAVDHPLVELGVALDEPLADDLFEPLPIHRLIEQQHVITIRLVG
jgi:hypothetical protein